MSKSILCAYLTAQIIGYQLLRVEPTKHRQYKMPSIDCFGNGYHFINFPILVRRQCVYVRVYLLEIFHGSPNTTASYFPLRCVLFTSLCDSLILCCCYCCCYCRCCYYHCYLLGGEDARSGFASYCFFYSSST